MSRNPKRYNYNDYNNVVLNHLENNLYLVSKKNLYFSIRDYYAKLGNIFISKIVSDFLLLSYIIHYYCIKIQEKIH